ncbi:hypothetical protein [Actinoplanes palleronii]|uniref:Uncharacterized protein n=1 Tax=Actinoplanes palleronii TaxID=113570 RepID=A0ABQ4BJH9_9ACTN|nr:hypothetical protein [Actinoplanes palleronii]GIE70767.1 hypothetical protein Apa02nite_068750 [Actinoplanes palleronii]
MIEPTDEMIYAFAGEPEITATDAHAIRVGLAAALGTIADDVRLVLNRHNMPVHIALSPDHAANRPCAECAARDRLAALFPADQDGASS